MRYINLSRGRCHRHLCRAVRVGLSGPTGQWVVENVGGGGGDIGVSAYARAQPDGYTLGLGGVASHGISPTLKAGKLPFDANKDFTFVSTLWSLPNFLVANNNIPANTVPELIALIKTTPASITSASAGQRHHYPFVRRALRCWVA
ncbi:MAG: hypothetical protein IPM01_27730 [Burkholderiaceae bacterium]|nr:hypothetical protein [Burkholderiaceae bacterium]